MTDWDELDDYVDLAREEIAALRACTEAEWQRIAQFQHNLRVSWVYPQRDWRGRDLY